MAYVIWNMGHHWNMLKSARWKLAVGDFVFLPGPSVVQIRWCLFVLSLIPLCVCQRVLLTSVVEPFSTLADELCVVDAHGIVCALLYEGGSATAPIYTFFAPWSCAV